MLKRPALAAAALLAGAAPALAHLDPVAHGSFASGLSHPPSGADHILAMVAVGLWAALLGGRALWLVPLAFLATMAAGFGAALLQVPLPFVEPVILASIVALGLLTATALRVPAIAAAGLVGFFALFHGHAHGSELGTADGLAFLAGFVLSTALLHAVGLGLGLGLGRLAGAGRWAARLLGAGTALAGVWLAMGA